MSKFEQINYKSVSDNSTFLSSARKRVKKPLLVNSHDQTSIRLPDPDLDDPDFLELLKEYDDDSDYDAEREKETLRTEASTPLLTQGAVYLSLVVGVGLFVLLVNWYNVRQLERLKIEYGLDGEKPPTEETWWNKALFYRILVQSFKDSNEDGLGDIDGLRSHIDHLLYLGVDAVLLCPIFESPMVDIGYDVSDFKTVHHDLGNIDKFEKLVEELQEKGIKVVLELVPNHTSRRHKWFQQSRKGGLQNTYKDYYIWHSGRELPNGTRVPPSNWVSLYGGSAWTWDEERLQYYYSYYHHTMPDLNHRDTYVREDVIESFRFWLEKGIDGVFIHDIHVLFETDEVILDEPLSEVDEAKPGQHRYLEHIYTEDQPEIHEFIAAWREFIEGYSLRTNKKIAFLVDAGPDQVDDVVKYYITGADGAVSYALTDIDGECGGLCVHDKIDMWITHMPDEHEAMWMMSSPNHQRITRMKGALYHNVLNMLLLLLPGAAVTYYGEELGLEETNISYSELRDPWGHLAGSELYQEFSRDPARGPMPWTSGRYAAFTLGEKPWLPLHSDYKQTNVETQKMDASGSSPIQLFHRLARLRKEVSFHSGKIQYANVNTHIFSFMRFAKDSAPYLVTLNFGPDKTTDDYTLATGVQIGKVVAHARPNKGNNYNSRIQEGSKINLEKLSLWPGEGLVLLLLMDIEFDVF